MNEIFNLVTPNFQGLAPGICLLAAAAVILIVPEKIKQVRQLLSVAIPAFALGMIIAGDSDSLSRFFCIIFASAAIVIGIYNFDISSKNESAAALMYAGSTICAALTPYWITLAFFWELVAVSAAYLVWIGGTKASHKATLRYIIYHMLGGNLLLAGGLIYVISTGNNLIEPISASASGAAYWLILGGIGINAGLPPMHSWISDAYPESTFAGSVYMNSFTTKLAVMMMIRVFAGTEILVYIGVFMAIFAACMAFMENDLRRLLSYHIVSQVGYMVCAVGVGSDMALDGAAAHAFNNIIFKGVLLMIAGMITYATGKRKITELSGLFKKMPFMSICFLICSLAIAGVPFLNGFGGKLLIMTAVDDGGYHIADMLLILASVGTWLSITLKINYFVFFGPCDGDKDKLSFGNIPFTMKATAAIGTATCVVIGLIPGILFNILPYGSSINTFEPGHMIDYIILFAAATISFVLLRSRLKPHDVITLDIDWIFRCGVKKLVLLISELCRTVNDTLSAVICEECHKVGVALNRGYKKQPEDEFGGPIGAIIIPLIMVFGIFVLTGLLSNGIVFE